MGESKHFRFPPHTHTKYTQHTQRVMALNCPSIIIIRQEPSSHLARCHSLRHRKTETKKAKQIKMFHENPNEFIVCTCSTATTTTTCTVHTLASYSPLGPRRVKNKHCDGQENKNESMEIACVHYSGVEVTKSVSHYAPRSGLKCVKSKHSAAAGARFVFSSVRILPFTFVYPIPPNWKPPNEWREKTVYDDY